MLPHTEYGRKFVKLIKAAHDNNKILFCCGSSFFSVVCYFACKSFLELNILNITDEFKIIEDVEKISDLAYKEINLKDRFLDYSTGNLYSISEDNTKWIPQENTGYHNRLIASKYSMICFIII